MCVWDAHAPAPHNTITTFHSTIVDRAKLIGLDWEGTMAARRRHDWDAELAAVVDAGITYPDYYTQPFHAYELVGGCRDLEARLVSAT